MIPRGTDEGGYDEDARTDSDKAGRNGRIITIFITGGKVQLDQSAASRRVGIALLPAVSKVAGTHFVEKDFFVAGGMQRYAGGYCMERFLQQ